MNVFEAVKQSVTTRQAASFYGIRVGRNGMVCCPFHNDRTPSMKVDSRFYCFGCGASGDVIDFSALLHGLGKREAAVRLAEDFGVSYEKSGNAPPDRKRHNRSQPRQNQRSRDFRKRNGIVSGCYAIICACWSIGKQHTPHSRRMPSGILFCGSVAEDKLHRIPFGYFVIRRNRRKSGIDRRTGKGGVAA